MKKLREFIDEIIAIESSAADKAHKKGLTYAGYGKWKDKSGKIVAKSVNDRLIDLTKSSKLRKKPSYKDEENIIRIFLYVTSQTYIIRIPNFK